MDESNDAQSRVMRLAGRDPFLASLGVICLDGGPGRAAVALTLRDEHINFFGACHGGVIFTLADTAFGLAANSHGVIAAGIDAHITYHASGKVGDTVTATAVEVSRSRKLAVYRVDVTRGDGTLLSAFTGTVYVTTKPNE
jgi:acyl-CoA thioesterase